MSVDFSCKVCGIQCSTAPQLPDLPVCEDHCEDHEYEYDASRRDKFCKHCDKQIDPDYWSGD